MSAKVIFLLVDREKQIPDGMLGVRFQHTPPGETATLNPTPPTADQPDQLTAPLWASPSVTRQPHVHVVSTLLNGRFMPHPNLPKTRIKMLPGCTKPLNVIFFSRKCSRTESTVL